MKILVPYDGSESAHNAIEYALNLAKNHKSNEITIITVACADAALARGVVFNPVELMNSCHDFFQARLEKAKALFDAAGVKVETIIESGDPAGVIIETVKGKGFDRVIMGKRGHSRLSELLLGSVSNKVLNSVQVPVTLVK